MFLPLPFLQSALRPGMLAGVDGLASGSGIREGGSGLADLAAVPEDAVLRALAVCADLLDDVGAAVTGVIARVVLGAGLKVGYRLVSYSPGLDA
jgi:hypothetical protein